MTFKGKIDKELILKLVKNKYFIFGVILIIFTMSLRFSTGEYKKQVIELQKEKREYIEEIISLKQQLKDLSEKKNIEKYAREHFKMKAENEDIFLVKKKKDN